MRYTIIKLVLLYGLTIVPVSAGFICPEASTEYRLSWQRPNLPEMHVDQNSELAGYCQTNPHGFGMTSTSLPRPTKQLLCYTYGENRLVLELPNRLFCEGWSGNVDYIVYSYALSLAKHHWSGFELVLFNEKHKVYRRITIDKDHLLFEIIRQRQQISQRMSFVTERLLSGVYTQTMASCVYTQKTTDGHNCPSEIPDNVSPLPFPLDTAIFTRLFSKIPSIKHEEYE